jgi:hypothetical protein
MAQDIDPFPLYDPLIKKGTENLSNVWQSYISTFYENLVGYLSLHGIFVPQITDDQRLAIQAPVNGQMIYNTTTNTFMGFINGAWKTFTLT